MNADRCIELSLGRAAVERNRQALNDFPGIGAYHVAPEHLVCTPFDHEFHHHPFITAGERVLERPEAAPVNVDLELAGPCLVLGKPYGPAIRSAENGCGDVEVIRLGWIVIEERLSHCHALGNRHRR